MNMSYTTYQLMFINSYLFEYSTSIQCRHTTNRPPGIIRSAGDKPMNVQVAVIYHSGYGHTARVAQAVARGIDQNPAASSLLIAVAEIDQYWDQLEKADAIIFGSPTYMGSASAPFKAFMDATSRLVFAKGSLWVNKVAAGFTNAASRSGDKLATLQQLMIFAAQHGMHWVNLGLPPGHNSSTTTEDMLNRDTYFVGAAAQSNYDESADVAPRHPDLLTAEYLGARVAQVTRELVAGRRVLAQEVA
jgi:NAD(P)H dehydrogenase (quinone)